MAAAEAAIANPLLDETTMKGAEGLLISITGGRDMTLFEVDEAATRIREEVDQDANIILGATFDEELEGLIRVSVVATGIDRAAGLAAGNEHSTFGQRTASQPSQIRPSAPQMAAPAPRPVQAPVASAPAPASDPVADTIRAAENEMERELEIAATAAAKVSSEQLSEFQPASRLFAGQAPARPAAPAPSSLAPAPVPQMPTAQAPAPQERAPEAVAPVLRTEPESLRMPRVEDFPPVVQAEIEQRRGSTSHEQVERGPMGLLKRLSASLGKHEDEVAAPTASAPHQPEASRRPLSAEASVYAPRRGQLDDQGRVNPPSNHGSIEDDQLEIPAFLRRQVK